MKIRKATIEDVKQITKLGMLLWEDAEASELECGFTETIQSDKGVIFVAEQDRKMIAFSECLVRTDYVEGTSSSPVGYLEAIYVREEYRHQSVATELLRHSESWARLKGCKEFGSDTEVENVDSIRFHKKSGFIEANRIVCFYKKL